MRPLRMVAAFPPGFERLVIAELRSFGFSIGRSSSRKVEL